MGVRLIPPGTPCGIVGAEEVWAAGGKVYVVDLETVEGQKMSTTRVEEWARGACEVCLQVKPDLVPFTLEDTPMLVCPECAAKCKAGHWCNR